MDATKDANPNLAEIAAKQAFKPTNAPLVAETPPRYALTPAVARVVGKAFAMARARAKR
jgi:hypothetical protein